MSKGAQSLFVFGVYLALLGLTLVAVPNFLLNIFGFPSTDEVWIRVVGVVVLVLSYYYIMASRKEMTDFFHWTVYARCSVMVFFVAFVLLDLASPTLILFGLVDLLSAIWTALALRAPKPVPQTA